MTADIPSTPLLGLHLLLTYECNFECDHCFVWGAPSQSGTMTGESIDHILTDAAAVGTIKWVYFEGGEAFLYYETLLSGVHKAKDRGFNVGIVTNASWATSNTAAMQCLQPLAGFIDDLSISSDVYHGGPAGSEYPEIARNAARQLGMPVGFISVAKPEAADVPGSAGNLAAGESAVHYRGRAAELLAPRVATQCWERFTKCPWENLRHPQRLHVDHLGYLHVCQGISIGNMFERPLAEIMAGYDPDAHPIVGPLLAGGPAEIVRRHNLAHENGYADHCHLCYQMRCALRERYPDVLAPDQMYRTI